MLSNKRVISVEACNTSGMLIQIFKKTIFSFQIGALAKCAPIHPRLPSHRRRSVISRFNIYDGGSIDLKIVILLDSLTCLITAAPLHLIHFACRGGLSLFIFVLGRSVCAVLSPLHLVENGKLGRVLCFLLSW